MVHHADGSTRQYHYEDQAHASHITGITDENGHRFATSSYDSVGRVASSQHSGGSEQVTLSYESDGSPL